MEEIFVPKWMKTKMEDDQRLEKARQKQTSNLDLGENIIKKGISGK